MRHIKPYQELFESQQGLIQEQIDWLDKCAKRKWKLNRQTGLVDVVGNFDCSGQGLTDLKGVRFGKVSGVFDCDNNQLTTLVGAPKTIKGDFRCYLNELTSLVGAPQSVGGGFDCEDNQLTTLVGAPKTVGGSFDCRGNPVSERTLEAIFALMKSGESYQQALEERWPRMTDEDRVLMYKQMPNLSPEDARKYKALATYNNIKGYL
ncbi:MAG: hypothetical protein JW384_02534 [Nitrosomonadaceae bacterium]|nr:hypothetical protein [Nitrosomonadaceae bacterium]